MTSRLMLRLVGDNARLGELYASDLARLITGIEQAVGRAAEQLSGRAPSGSGSPHGAVARSVGLRLAGLEDGSTAGLRTPTGSSIKVCFTDDRALDIKEALRENSQVQGRITHNEATSSIVSADLTEISLTEQMLMPDPEDFWVTRSLEDLAKAQGLKPCSPSNRFKMTRSRTKKPKLSWLHSGCEQRRSAHFL